MNATQTPRPRIRKNLPGFKKPGRFWLALIFVLFLGSWLALRLTILADLPAVDDLESRLVRPTTRILDRNGRLLYEVLDPNAGKQIDLAADAAPGSRYGIAGIPDACVQATLATEDSRFFWHPGVDPIAIGRALWQNWRADGAIVSGASTLTQQLARSVLMEPEERYVQSYDRKLREAVLALQLELRYSKAELLRLYLNQTYYGNFAFGLEAAAQNFFAKPGAQLSRAECALLTGLIQYPTGYNPFADPETAKNRQLTVLRLMTDAGFITQAESDQIAAESLRYRSQLFAIEAPHFVMYIQDQLVRAVGVDRLRDGGLEVRTTLDLGLQRQAQAAVTRRLAQLNCLPQGQKSSTSGQTECNLGTEVARNGAAVVLDAASGEILAMVGSPDYFDESNQGNVNAVLSQRQPGSAIKPLTYAAALDPEWSRQAGVEPLTPASILADLPTAFPGGRGSETAANGSFGDSGAYRPENYDLRYHGPVSVREALSNSYNIPAVRAMEFVGVQNFIPLAQRLGISTLTRPDYGLSLSLGGGEIPLLEMTGAFAVLANGGLRRPPQAIVKIEDGEGNVICEMDTPVPCRLDGLGQGQQVISPVDVFLISDMLSDNAARAPVFGLNSVLNLGRPAAVKTGTTNDYRDALTIGYTPELVTGVWIGNASNAPMQNLAGVGGAGPIWNRFMQSALAATPPSAFPVPEGVQQVEVCADTGTLPSQACPAKATRWFAADRPPLPPENDLWQIVRIDRVTGQRAGEFTPSQQVEEKVFKVYPEQYRGWAESHGIPQPPAEESALFDFAPEVQITQPGEGENVRGVISVVGVANVPAFASYELQYGISHDPGAFSGAIWGPIGQPSSGGILGQWDTATVANGPHTLRLVVRDSFGNSYESRVRLFVDTPAATVTPTPLPSPTWTPTWTPTPEAAAPTPLPLPTETPVIVVPIEPPSPLPTLSLP